MKRLRLNGPLVLGSLIGLGLLVLLVLPWVVKLRDPYLGVFLADVGGGKLMAPPYKPGVAGYLLGSDFVGRDLLSRLVYGARTTLLVALVISAARWLLALPIGLASAWRGGWAAGLTRTLATGFSAIPSLVMVAIVLLSLKQVVFATNTWMAVYGAALIVVGVPRLAEQVRRRAVAVRLMPHIEAAVATGAGGGRIVRRHILPVMVPDLLVMGAAEMAWVLLTMGQLAVFMIFVGGTVKIEKDGWPTRYVEWQAEWGQMLGANRTMFLSNPWIPLYPGMALGLAAACFHLLAEGLRLRFLRR
jgi:peptide/nickel transport system permease protein